ncbi:MAG: fumarate hydratase [Actinomycetes bacterium]|nr:fumarate hydratase [Actinomycetes bacterium]
MRDSRAIAQVVGRQIAQAATVLRPDVVVALEAACARETNARARNVLSMLLENAHLSAAKDLPLCQDTGTVWVLLEAGEDVTGFPPDLQQAIDAEVARVYKEQGLRASTVRDALCDRSNPGDNTPAFIEYRRRLGKGLTVSTLLKGAGSDNASQVVMLPPAAGKQGIMDALTSLVREKGSAACPPLVIGVGVGTTFDKVASLAKRALLRPVGQASGVAQVAQFEAELLAAVNATGVGPAGLGGATSALGVAVETAPAHIAALPVAFNLGCCAMRSASEVVRAIQ